MQVRTQLRGSVKVIKLSKRRSHVTPNRHSPSVGSNQIGNPAIRKGSVIEKLKPTMPAKLGARDVKNTLQPNIQLLSGILDIFKERNVPKLRTRTILRDLAESAFCNGKEISSRRLALLLKEFGIHSRDIRFQSVVAKGYLRESFTDALSRYEQ